MKKNIYKKTLHLWMVVLFSSPSYSQENSSNVDAGSSARAASIVTRISITEYYTDNYYRTNENKQSGWTTDVSPGVHLSSSTGRIVGSLDYSLHQIIQSNDSSKNELQNALDATGSVEIIDKWAFVDANGKISQRTISAFGTQSTVDGFSNANKTEVSSYRVSPYIKGRLSYFADYEGRYEASTTRAKDAQFANTNGQSANFKLNGVGLNGRLHWGSQLSTNKVEQSSNQTSRSDSIKNTLGYLIDPQFNLTASFGREYGNYSPSENSYKNTSGIGAIWTPSERTTVSADIENAYAGKMHKLNFEHRTPKTSWRVSDAKSVSLTNSITSNSIQGNTYDLLFSQLASIEPDPIKRAEMVNNLLLTNYGTSSGSILNGYLTSGASIQRTRDFSFSLLGVRDILTFTAMQSVGQKINQSSIGFDGANAITQRAITFSLTHRLNPDTSLNTQLTSQKTSSDGSNLTSNLKSFSVDASTKLNLKTIATFGVRRTIYSGGISPYNANSINGGLSVQF
jgi:uncharacterized protein (PEP-CTERM system associated)